MLITVFTPTYNRAYTLNRVFDSLMAQTFPHDKFEWILIDDGSSDNTQELVKYFLQKTDVKINYIYQENRGKNYCHNKAITLARGELFLILDSDDAITSDCMNIFWNHWQGIEDKIKENIYGINCLCRDGYTNKIIGHKVKEGLFSDGYRWKHENRVYSEAWGALNTKLFKKHLFPEIEGIKFIPEAYLWDSLSNNRILFATNDTLRIVFHQNDGFTKNLINSYKNHSKGRYIYYLLVINRLFYKLLKYNPLRAIKDMIQFGRMGLHSGYSFLKMLKDIKSIFKKVIFAFLFPVSYYFYRKDILNDKRDL